MPGELVLHALRHVWRTLTPLNVPVAVVGVTDSSPLQLQPGQSARARTIPPKTDGHAFRLFTMPPIRWSGWLYAHTPGWSLRIRLGLQETRALAERQYDLH